MVYPQTENITSVKNTELAKDKAQKDIEKYISKIVDISKKFDIQKEEVIDIFNLFYGSDE